MVVASTLGFPRIGANRELKKLVESFWAAKCTEQQLLAGASDIRRQHWLLQRDAGIQHVATGDFSLYDHVLDHAYLFGAIPQRYAALKPGLETYFAMARGLQCPEEGVDVSAMEMKKWFDTNYHYIVPEFEAQQQFALASSVRPVDELVEARGVLGSAQPRPVLLGPVSFLLLGKPAKGQSTSFRPIQLLARLLPVYVELVKRLVAAGATWIQVDEPCLVLDLSAETADAYRTAYAELAKVAGSDVKLLLATYFGRLDANADVIADLPVAAVHVDLVRAPEQLDTVLAQISSGDHKSLSLGLVNGRNVWKSDLAAQLALAKRVVEKLGKERVFVAPSSSLLHVPHSIAGESKMDEEVRDWLAFAVEKLHEVVVLATALRNGEDAVREQLDANARSIQARRTSLRTRNPVVRERLNAITDNMKRRQSPFIERQRVQEERLHLPVFPTTTVGSFPQTKEVRAKRAALRKGTVTQQEYDQFMNEETKRCVEFQEDAGIDVLVHGEFERNDMVEFFGEQLEGYAFTSNGWVASYGSRCVKPPIIYGDVSRPRPMTVHTTKYAASLTRLPMKGMLTGPITCLQWSFVRDDQPRRDTANQLALAIRDEVMDLEIADIPCIQIDEPAIREGLPLRRGDWDDYLRWAVDAFLLATTGVRNATQIHTHMCYSDFQDIFPAIQRMDADVLSIENSRSDLKLLSTFDQHAYANWIGPGVYDIHSPRVPSAEEMLARAQQLLEYLPARLLWINPDCGLKTRGWKEVDAALRNMVQVAKQLRSTMA